MQDPIGNFLQIRELFLSYLDTAFRIKDENVAEERRRLLTTPGTLCVDPLIEPLPRYQQYPREFHELIQEAADGSDPLSGMTEDARKAFVELVLSGLFPSRERRDGEDVPTSKVGLFKPYIHQIMMLERGRQASRPGVVTSGTGSGKTESFLLPIFAAISEEAKQWPRPRPGYLQNWWWHNPETNQPWSRVNSHGSLEPCYTAIPLAARASNANPMASPVRPHRAGETRQAAVRALILYPMNALVEDQLVRLRKALDSREARETMDSEFSGNRVFFGRYTGQTPVTGYEAHPAFTELLSIPANDARLLQHPRISVGEAEKEDHSETLREMRESQLRRVQRKQRDLFERMVEFEADQRAGRQHAILRQNPDQAVSEEELRIAPSKDGDDAPFMFPSVDGGELVSRWDFQRTPPDVLITNVSMLSAMLTREVDAPIFEKTREWLDSKGSYFYLVLDELHLQRGSAGTEVCYLLRLLLHRLGLHLPERRHKLRILASSASLPAAPDVVAERSSEFLWDMFGTFGLGSEDLDEASARKAWVRAIVPGREESVTRGERFGKLASGPFVSYLRDSLNRDAGSRLSERPATVIPPETEAAKSLWAAMAAELGVQFNLEEVSRSVRNCVSEVANHVSAACWDEVGGRSRATSTRELAWRLFLDLREMGRPIDIPYEIALTAVRALLFVRGGADGMRSYLGISSDITSFRLHTFFRSLEGLYAPAWKNAGVSGLQNVPERATEIGRLSIEREARVAVEIPEIGKRSLRQLELLYCECCGELFFGGMRSQATNGRGRENFLAELLPHEPHLDGLPDKASSQRFEEMSFDNYAVFWPASEGRAGRMQQRRGDLGSWRGAILDRTNGIISRRSQHFLGQDNAEGGIAGYIFERTPGRDRHGRNRNDGESHVPYMCPQCGTDYFRRTSEMGRLSPIRNFRTGFAKTTQLLATEQFAGQRLSSPEIPAKLVSFSDSRQDAAKAALDIEKNHHVDLRRELLFISLWQFETERRRSPVVIREEIESARRGAQRALEESNFSRARRESERLEELLREEIDVQEPSIALASVIDDVGRLEADGGEVAVSWLIGELVRRGVHPYDPAGLDRPRGLREDGSEAYFRWDDLYMIDDGGRVLWRSSDEDDRAIRNARVTLINRFLESLSEVLYSKTYYSPEESGLAYLTIALSALPAERRSEERVALLSALMRVISDSYRYFPSPFLAAREHHPDWSNLAEIHSARVKEFARACWGHSYGDELLTALADLGAAGHRGGELTTSAIRLRLIDPMSPYWRCSECSRVHLHLGGRICTRCFSPFPAEPTGVVSELHASNFLAKRVVRGFSSTGSDEIGRTAFRLRCEELTGQTRNPTTRQRYFREIFVSKSVPALLPDSPQARFERQKKGLDLLCVTTTMEVGIDIGPLQAVMQANMPPQRFNYQQRVGRAGRRGQAFSMALTVCRTRSHDIYYFREPQKITGDIPPTPFLTKRMGAIALRMYRKAWMVEAFRRIREAVRSRELLFFPGDVQGKPDIHGEFVPTDEYLSETGQWQNVLRSELEATRGYADSVERILVDSGRITDALNMDVESLLLEVGEAARSRYSLGLAETVAEAGLFPMYGMPTRVRNLYLQFLRDGNSAVLDMLDRDIDIAIYEFAPGSILVRDKREHLCVGFSPGVGVPGFLRRNAVSDATLFQESPFGERFRLGQCRACGAWRRGTTDDRDHEPCGACGAPVSQELLQECVVPNAFRSDFLPKVSRDDGKPGSRHRSIQAEGAELHLSEVTLPASDGLPTVCAKIAFDPMARTYRLNRGPERAGNISGFEISVGDQDVRVGTATVRMHEQAVDTSFSLNGFQQQATDGPIWLAAPKTTDSLILAPGRLNPELSLSRLLPRVDGDAPTDAFRWQGVRSAALSGTFLLVNRIALELDIDPIELEVLEPRLYGQNPRLPILQITDELVNGAGFCRHLSETGKSAPRILELLRSVVFDGEAEPLRTLRHADHSDCEASCYRCLLRYGNQQYHGLLDWKLGMSYLRALLDVEFSCGLDGNFDYPALEGWPIMAIRIADEFSSRFGGERRDFANGQIPGVRIPLRNRRLSGWILVAHPLWNFPFTPGTGTILESAIAEASSDLPVECWDSFNLARRQIQVRERVVAATSA